MRNLSPRPSRRNSKYRHKSVSLDYLWANVCSAYSQQGNWRAGEDKAFSKALAAFEARFCPENLNSNAVVVDFRKGRGRR
jgi:hypothetical protein